MTNFKNLKKLLTCAKLLNERKLSLNANAILIEQSLENVRHISGQSHETVTVGFFGQYFRMNWEIRWHIL